MTRIHVTEIVGWVGLLVCLCSSLCRADGPCATTMNSNTYKCNYDDCHSVVTVQTPEGPAAQSYTCSSEGCCGQLFTKCSFLQSDCDQGVLRSAAMRDRVRQVSDTSRVLLADCQGHYNLYERTPGAPAEVRRPPLIDERILR
jgi:hypothetical protein